MIYHCILVVYLLHLYAFFHRLLNLFRRGLPLILTLSLMPNTGQGHGLSEHSGKGIPDQRMNRLKGN